MDSSFFVIVDLLVVACGIYMIYQYVMLLRTHDLKQNMLMPKDLEVKKCKDVDGYIKMMGPKMITFGVAAVVTGGLDMLQDMQGIFGSLVSLIIMIIFVVLCFWYGMASRKASKMFW